MSNVYGAGSPAAGLNAPGGTPSWLQNIYNFVNPMAQATAGGVDAQGRPQNAITAAQQALAAQALAGGPQASGPIANSQAGNVSTAGATGAAPVPPVSSAPLAPPSALAALRAALAARGGSSGGGGASASYSDPSIAARMSAARIPPTVAAYAGAGQGPFAGRPTETPSSGFGQGPFAGQPPAAAGGRNITVQPHARQQAQVAAAAPQVPWIDSKFERQNLPAGNGPLSRNTQRQMGVIDFSKLFNRNG